MKYTIQELVDKKINIYCPTEVKFIKVIEYLKSKGVENNLAPFNALCAKEKTCVCLVINKKINTYWKSIETVEKHITTEEFFGEGVESTSDCCSAEAPSVINEATAAFDRFLKEWNALHKKAMKIKSIKSLDKLTDKIKEL